MPQPNTQLQAVLFDLDGTLLDTAPDFIWVINRLLAQEQHKAQDFDALRQQVSNGATAMVCTAFDLPEQHPRVAALRQRFLDIYLEHLAIKTEPFAGIMALLDWLEYRAIPWGIVTNKPELYTHKLLQRLELHHRAGTIICPEQVQQRKPHPESIWLACRELGCTPENSVYVGDHIRDIEAGRRAGLTTIAALYGYIGPDENPRDWRSDHNVDSADAIKPLLQSLYCLS
ncbi:HAD family hydrolase [Marinobacterium sedimentorum]|uniref:HAD family hydrolase n=1 Tax=Marinobacterium sedimentorum TaxID=2927804 RepID=UPI0020C6DFBE|nr:HAD-IA family hydrolase [Marinobacterium sedimentorum]MCP8689743.1 HAD-IA family hydrolase [Marinobacterium sedimentorum]